MVRQFEQEVASFSVVFVPTETDEEDLKRLRDSHPWGETDRVASESGENARWWSVTAFCLVALVLVVVAVVVRQVDATIPAAPGAPSMSEQRDAAKVKVDRRSPVERGDAKGSDR